MGIPQTRKSTSSSGYIFLLTLILVFLITGIGLAVTSVAAAKYAKTKRDTYVRSANYAAEAGISATIQRLYDERSIVGAGYSATDITLPTSDGNKFTYNAQVEAGPNATSRYITSIGKAYVPASASNPTSTQKIRVLATKNTTKGPYNVYAGAGGISLNTNSKILANYVYSDGPVAYTGTGGTVGDSTGKPARVDISNVRCLQNGTGTRFPYVCPSGNEPLTIPNSNTLIGTVCAYGQTTSTNISAYPTYAPALYPSCAPTRSIINVLDRSTVTPTLTNTYSASTGSCAYYNGQNAATGIYTGNVTIQNCNYNTPSVMYVKGDLTINGTTTIRPQDSTGAQGSTVIATGTITLDNATSTTNSSKGGIKFISYNSSDTATTPTPGCTPDDTCTGFQDNSSGWSKANSSIGVSGIVVRNSNSSNTSAGEFTSNFGTVLIDGNSGGADTYVTSASGQKLTLNTGQRLTVSTQTTASDVQQNRWVISDYRRAFN